jgi:predicted nucleic acid-binding protein
VIDPTAARTDNGPTALLPTSGAEGLPAQALTVSIQAWSALRLIPNLLWPELSADVERVAGSLAATHHVRGADAVHLASALALGSTDLTVAVWDKRLHAGAGAVGLAVAPATLT